ncbi:Rox3 mediator complex subunit-domain-containing protein [Calycina marina]|uniref:Mediator of RNA polymerase II transcription subunit 19 n=1 Tax=Calycina marina TaxID=1763456 RepID=A0A9P8CBD8_9HELO|nr:Rox3 mediator complex subunit-domain-containing protein [Calycina marina]
MPSNHPPSPQSPDQPSFDSHDIHHKLPTSPGVGGSLPTPAHSINGSMSTLDVIAEAAHSEEISNKRKRDLEDTGDRDQKKVHIESSGVSINDLHRNVGPKYRLCKTPYNESPVPYQDDLFALYGLEDLAALVAREHPDGTKNTMRKTYKGHIKKLQICGAFDTVAKEEGAPDTLWQMVAPGFTDESRDAAENRWQAQYGTTAKLMLDKAPVASDQIMQKAVTMAKGNVPRNLFNPKALSMENQKKVAAPAVVVQAKHNGGARAQVHAGGNHQVGGAQRMGKLDAARPQRNNAKRQYTESVYEGYGEGYVDDEMQDPGYSTGDGEDAMGGRKRAKKSFGNSLSPFGSRQTSYGPGSIGV